MSIVMVFLGIIVVMLLYTWTTYNRLVVLRNRVKEAWSSIEIQLKRRYDLIPNLVETVKGYAAHEAKTLEAVIQARNAAMSSTGTVEDHARSENILTGALKSVFALSESYPDLKANANFLELQRELVDTEDKLQATRRFYNSNVLAYNTKRELFPSNVIAGLFSFQPEKLFELDEADKAAREPVKVKF